ncbi:MAG: PilZ domain-containing protein [Acidobacteria bacterium]|nr:PilZ domain-containing protein [Acidobacteriota bacterium]
MGATQPPWRHSSTGSSDSRRATRHAAQLDARLFFQLSTPKPDDTNDNAIRTPRTLRLVGRTRNISETGIAFIVPTLRIGDEFAHVIGSRLLIRLYLPAGHVEIQATPVRYEQLSQSSSERGYLIGVRITEMTDSEWVRMVEYIRTLHKPA